jgi:hypothetical protein
MNLFILDKSPVKAARMQCDKHVVKMIVESAQMMSTAHRILDGVETKRPSKSGKRMVKYWELPDAKENVLYKAVHFNHPCTVWTMECIHNYRWHYNHFFALCKEYEYRYEKRHATFDKLELALKIPPKNIPDIGRMTPFKLAMKSNPECMFPDDPIKSYKMYYKTKKENFKMVWTKRETPAWFLK